jgi:hypothetical protein
MQGRERMNGAQCETGELSDPSLWSAQVARLVPSDALREAASTLAGTYRAAKPFPHIVLDGLWDDAVLDRVEGEFPSPGRRNWHKWATENELKETSRGIRGLEPFSALVIELMNSSAFIDGVKAITGIVDLLPDPTFHGAGLHESGPGGWLDVHADYLKHPELPLARRVNVLVYLNRDWRPEWKGDLELWDPDTHTCAASIPPLFNRTVIFDTTEKALHGFPSPLVCPVGRYRRLISVYYWSADAALRDKAAGIQWLKAGKRRLQWRDFVPPIAVQALRRMLAR